MKKLLLPLFSLALLLPAATSAQKAITSPSQAAEAARALTKFNLDFPGGTPQALATAIQKATGRPLNVVVPIEFAATELPPLKMNGVNVVQLFSALSAASQRKVVASYGRAFSQLDTSYGFRTNSDYLVDDDSIWNFFVNNAPQGLRVARFYLLAPYLQAGLTVDDITTAIQTSWKMLGQKERPELSFHKETKLLIAVGYDTDLATIEAALKTLDAALPKPAPTPKPDEEKKTKP